MKSKLFAPACKYNYQETHVNIIIKYKNKK